MPESTPTTLDRTVVVHRYGVLTWISLGFNALILLLILIGIVCHHHHRMAEKQDQRGAWGGHPEQRERGDWGRGGFGRQDEGGMHHEWGHRDFGGGGGCGDEHGFGDWRQRRFGMDEHRGWGGGPGFGTHGMGGPGEMGAPGGMSMMPQSAEAMTDRFMLAMTDKLKLTDAESAQIRPILQGQIEQFQKDMEAQKAAHQKMIEDAQTKIRAILTPDQQKQFDAMTAKFGADKTAEKPKPTF